MIGRFAIPVVVLAAFGPYLLAGLRTDQLLVYGLAFVSCPFLLSGRMRLPPVLAVIFVAWLVLVAIAVVGWIGTTPNLSNFPSGVALANLDNLVLPLACSVFVTGMFLRTPGSMDRLQGAAFTIAAAMAGNAVLALAQFQGFPITAGLSSFWGGGGTAERALTLGRFTGVFSQPSLAGVAYSLALVCAIYALRRRPLVQALGVLLLVIGGVLTLSKAFIFVGVPVAMWQFLRAGQRRWPVFGFGLLAMYAAMRMGFFAQWSGADRLLRMVPGLDSNLASFTGNRYGETATVRPVVEAVMESYPLGGFGVRGLATATDSAFVFALVIGGLVGVAGTVTVLAAFVVSYVHQRRTLDRAERSLFGGVAIIVVVSAFGAPVLTGNRTAVIVWVLMTMLVLLPRRQRDENRQVRYRPSKDVRDCPLDTRPIQV